MLVLMLSASAKCHLARGFREALAPYGGQLLGSDLDPESPALALCDAVVALPPSDHPDFPASLKEVVTTQSLSLVLPTRDGELPLLAALAPELRALGTEVAIAAPDAVAACRDKARFCELCEALGLAVPTRRDLGAPDLPFPLFARPLIGSAGRGARRIGSASDLAGADPRTTLLQDFCDLPEYSIDLLADFQGQPLQAVSRRRIEVRDGEAVRSQVETIGPLVDQAMTIARHLGLVGHNVLQAFYSAAAGPLWIEANPRFGGASRLSIAAGLASPSRLLQLLAGQGDAARRPRAIEEGLSLADLETGP